MTSAIHNHTAEVTTTARLSNGLANEPAAHPSGTVLRLLCVFYGGPVSVNDLPLLADSAVDLRRVPTNAHSTIARVLVQVVRKDADVAV